MAFCATPTSIAQACHRRSGLRGLATLLRVLWVPVRATPMPATKSGGALGTVSATLLYQWPNRSRQEVGNSLGIPTDVSVARATPHEDSVSTHGSRSSNTCRKLLVGHRLCTRPKPDVCQDIGTSEWLPCRRGSGLGEAYSHDAAVHRGCRRGRGAAVPASRDQPKAFYEGRDGMQNAHENGQRLSKQTTHWLPAITPTSLQSHVNSGEGSIGYS